MNFTLDQDKRWLGKRVTGMNHQLSDQSAMMPGEEIGRNLQSVLSDFHQREEAVRRTQVRQAQLIDLGMLDVDLERLIAEDSDTSLLGEQIEHCEQQLGMR